jgi:hypothetical protein
MTIEAVGKEIGGQAESGSAQGACSRSRTYRDSATGHNWESTGIQWQEHKGRVFRHSFDLGGRDSGHVGVHRKPDKPSTRRPNEKASETTSGG